MPMTEIIAELRAVPRAARVAQGYPRIQDFAEHVMAVRRRRRLRRDVGSTLTAIRRDITARLQRILDERRDLRRAARDQAGLCRRDSAPVRVEYAPGAQGQPLYQSRRTPTVRRGTRRYVSVPACWMIRALREGGSLRAIEARHAAREQGILERLGPHWLERIAAGVLAQPAALRQETVARIEVRRQQIRALRTARRQAREITVPPLSTTRVKWRGIVMLATWRTRSTELLGWEGRVSYSMPPYRGSRDSRRALARYVLALRAWTYGRYRLERHSTTWRLTCMRTADTVRWDRRPTRSQIAAAIRADRVMTRVHRIQTACAQPDPQAPDTLGWRAWLWSEQRRALVSPHQHTVWETPELRAADYDADSALRGTAGIHARRMPVDWRHAGWGDSGTQEGPPPLPTLVTGIVERYQRYVLGATGWRAEWVVIRELQAPSVAIMLALMQRYPDVPVHLSPWADTETIEETGHAHR